MLMETVFHYGKESEKFLRDFENKRADLSIQEITELQVEELKAILRMFQNENRTFAEPTGAAV